jgi:hypothetical protein
MRSNYSYLLIVFCITLACSKDEPRTNQINLRLSNTSEFIFENATFNNVNFGTIEPGEKTQYKIFANQYAYGAVDITINGERFGWTPNDYVGEKLLQNGNYTFEFSFDAEEQTLNSVLVRDK